MTNKILSAVLPLFASAVLTAATPDQALSEGGVEAYEKAIAGVQTTPEQKKVYEARLAAMKGENAKAAELYKKLTEETESVDLAYGAYQAVKTILDPVLDVEKLGSFCDVILEKIRKNNDRQQLYYHLLQERFHYALTGEQLDTAKKIHQEFFSQKNLSADLQLELEIMQMHLYFADKQYESGWKKMCEIEKFNENSPEKVKQRIRLLKTITAQFCLEFWGARGQYSKEIMASQIGQLPPEERNTAVRLYIPFLIYHQKWAHAQQRLQSLEMIAGNSNTVRFSLLEQRRSILLKEKKYDTVVKIYQNLARHYYLQHDIQRKCDIRICETYAMQEKYEAAAAFCRSVTHRHHITTAYRKELHSWAKKYDDLAAEAARKKSQTQ